MKIDDIKKAILKKLHDNFPTYKLYGEEVPQGFKKPCFFVEILPVSFNNSSKYHIEKSINIDIHYFSENGTNAENFEMIDKLNEIFNIALEVNDRVFTINEINTTIVDTVLHFSFDINFTDALDETKVYDYQEYEKMQELNYKEVE